MLGQAIMNLLFTKMLGIVGIAFLGLFLVGVLSYILKKFFENRF